MSKYISSNNAHSELSVGIGPDDTSIQLIPGTGSRFPSPSGSTRFAATLYDSSGNMEVVHCVARSVDMLTVVRGAEGTPARSWVAGTRIQHRLTAAAFNSKADLTEPAFVGPAQITGDLSVSGTINASQVVAATSGTHTGPVVGNVTGNVSGDAGGSAETIRTVLPVSLGGTGASSSADARSNLGLGALATKNTANLASEVSGVLPLANGGTGADTAAGARTALGLGALALKAKVVLGDDVEGVLAVANGGTGRPTLSGYLKGNGTSAVQQISAIPMADVDGLASALANIPASAITGALTAAQVGITQNLSNNGWITFPGGFTIQWGFVDTGTTSEGSSIVNFPKAFTDCFAVFTTSLNSASSIDQNVEIQVVSRTTSGFTAYRQRMGPVNFAVQFFWLAIGV